MKTRVTILLVVVVFIGIQNFGGIININSYQENQKYIFRMFKEKGIEYTLNYYNSIIDESNKILFVLTDHLRNNRYEKDYMVLKAISIDTKNVIWEYKFVNTETMDGPFICKNKIYCVNYDGIWSFDIKMGYLEQTKETLNSSEISSDNRYLCYSTLKENQINILDLENDLQNYWVIKANDRIESIKSLENRQIIYCTNKMLYCADIVKKKILWTKEFDKVIDNFSSPDLQAKSHLGKVLFNFPDNKLYCVDANTGKEFWNLPVLWSKMNCTISANKTYFFLSVASTYLNGPCYLQCVNVENGNEIWRIEIKSKPMFIYSLPYQNDVIIYYHGNLQTYSENGQKLMSYDLGYMIDKVYLFEDKTLVYTDNTSNLDDDNVDDKDEIHTLNYFVKAYINISFITNSNKMKMDGKEEIIDSKPVIIGNITYIPAKYLVEPLGGQLTWNQKTKQIKANLLVPGSETLYNKTPEKYEFKENILELTVNSNKAILNGKSVQIDPKNPKITPIIINGRTMVPLRFLAESLGCKVEWKADTKEIIVTYQP